MLICLQEAALASLKSLNKTDVVEVRDNGKVIFKKKKKKKKAQVKNFRRVSHH